MRLRVELLCAVLSLSPLCCPAGSVKEPRFHTELVEGIGNVGTAIIQAEVDVVVASGEGLKRVVGATTSLGVTSVNLLSNLTLDLVEASLSLADLVIEAKVNLSRPLIEAVKNLAPQALETKKILISKITKVPKDLALEVLELKKELAAQTIEMLQPLGSEIIKEKTAAARFLFDQSMFLVNKSIELADQLIEFKQDLAISTLEYSRPIIDYKLQKIDEVKEFTVELALSSKEVLDEVYDYKLEKLTDLIGQVYNATLFYGQEFYSANVEVTAYIADLLKGAVKTKLQVVQAIANEGILAGEVIGAGVLGVVNAKIQALSSIYHHISQRLSDLYQ